jgi:hypothetical protein
MHFSAKLCSTSGNSSEAAARVPALVTNNILLITIRNYSLDCPLVETCAPMFSLSNRVAYSYAP